MLKLPDVDYTGSDVLLWKDQNDNFWAGPCSPEGRAYFTDRGVGVDTVAVEIIGDLMDFIAEVGEVLAIGVAMDNGKTGRIIKNRLQ